MNNSDEPIYIPLQYWETEIVKNGNHILAFPENNYAVNRVYIYENRYNGLRTTGSKCCYPQYENLPLFFEVAPDSSANLHLSIKSKICLDNLINYKAEIYICYYTYEILKNNINHFDDNKQEFLIISSPTEFFLIDGITNIKSYMTNIRITQDFLEKEYIQYYLNCKGNND